MVFAGLDNVSFAGCSFRWAGFTSCVVFVWCVGGSTNESCPFPDSGRDLVSLVDHPRAPRESKKPSTTSRVACAGVIQKGRGEATKKLPTRSVSAPTERTSCESDIIKIVTLELTNLRFCFGNTSYLFVFTAALWSLLAMEFV